LLTAQLPLPSCHRQFAVTGNVDLLLPPGLIVDWSHESNRAMQALRVVLVHILLDQPPGIIRRERSAGPDGGVVPHYESSFFLFPLFPADSRGT